MTSLFDVGKSAIQAYSRAQASFEGSGTTEIDESEKVAAKIKTLQAAIDATPSRKSSKKKSIEVKLN